MLFQSRCFWHPKDIDFANVYEDSYCLDCERGIIAIADGVSSAILSKSWADILTKGVIANPPNPEDAEAFAGWLSGLRESWARSTDFSQLNYFQRQKLERAGGGYSTLLWTILTQVSDGVEDQSAVRYSLRASALGDCCMFVVRDGQVLTRFPMESVQEFEADPFSICSCNNNHDKDLQFRTLETRCQGGDLVVLATDALSKWAYQQLETVGSVDWQTLWKMGSSDWAALVQTLRELPPDNRMRVDDTTMVILRLASRDAPVVNGDALDPSRPLIVSPYPEEASTDNSATPPEISEESTTVTAMDFQPVDEALSDEVFLTNRRSDTSADGLSNVDRDDLHNDLNLGEESPIVAPAEPPTHIE